MSVYTEQNILICKIRFYSEQDKHGFYEWIKKIDCIDKSLSENSKVYLYIAADDIHDYSLRDLLGLFYRYKIDMKPLSRYLTDDNKKWFFDNPKAYWHRKVFKVSKRS